MSKVSWETISSGLDQLWFGPFLEDETVDSRAETIETFLQSNGWDWDMVLSEMGKESGNVN